MIRGSPPSPSWSSRTTANHAQEMLQTVIDFIERRVELGVLGEVETELIPYGD